jgi:hypothetical protein
LAGVLAQLEGISLVDALEKRGISDANTLDIEVLRQFAGRPRYGMRLAEGILTNAFPDIVANEIVQEITTKLLPKLKWVSAGKGGSKSLYQVVRDAAKGWVLRGKPGVAHMGEIALETGVCALEMVETLESKSSSLPPSISFVIKEPLVIKAFTDLATADFQSVTDESDAQLGYMFEDYLAWNAQELCSMLNSENLKEDPKKKNPKEDPKKFIGTWRMASPHGDERRGVSCKDGEEPSEIRDILKNADGRGMSVVFPGTRMGPDIVFAAKDESTKRKLLVIVLAKASPRASGAVAMRSLTLLYHVNREKNPSVPLEFKDAYNEVNCIISDPNTMVVFLVVKQPNNVQASTFSVEVYEDKNGAKLKDVLHVYMDETSLAGTLPRMKLELDAYEKVKRSRMS